MYLLQIAATLLLLGSALADNATLTTEDSCSAHPYESGPWSCLLEEWATSASTHQTRHGRIMALPPAKGYYVSDRMDLMPPPPPPHHPPPHGHHGMPPRPHPQPYDEWQPSPPPPQPGKIVNRPTNPHKDKFKPSYPAPPPNYHMHPHGPPPNGVDRFDEQKPKPQKQVSETDLYLLSAIEKLVYKVDLIEKRLRKMEESVHYLIAGVDAKPEPCATNFTRVGGACYQFSSDALHWKGANFACRKLQANLLEIDDDQERRHLLTAMLADKRLQGGEYWTGGLNPGLLWIWSHSAKPAVANGTSVSGDGRCLSISHDVTRATILYRGDDCAAKHRYVCEKPEEDKLSNEIEKKARKMRDLQHRKPKIAWSDADP